MGNLRYYGILSLLLLLGVLGNYYKLPLFYGLVLPISVSGTILNYQHSY